MAFNKPSAERQKWIFAGAMGFVCLTILGLASYKALRPQKMHIIHFGVGCQKIAQEYLGGLNKNSSLTQLEFQNMMAELAACKGYTKEDY